MEKVPGHRLTRRNFIKNSAGAIVLGASVRAPELREMAFGPRIQQAAVKKVYVCPPCGLPCDKLTFDKPGLCPQCGMTLIENLDSSSRLNVQTLMEEYKVPGLSFAVINDFKIVSAQTFGVTEAGGSTPVTTETLFQAGSVSKPVAAVGALRLVEQGLAALDEDVNQQLKSWKVPENQFTREQKVTLRRILSHTAGLNVPWFPGYAMGEPLPTLRQILDGEKPANTPPVRVDFVPGSKWRYSGGGVLIEQQLMVDLTGKSFPQLMREIVFEKIGMSNSTYEQPLPPTRATAAAGGTDTNGKAVSGRWHIYPEMAAGGLWTTPSDLAKLAIEIALSKQGKSNLTLSRKMADEMLKPQAPRVDELVLGNAQHRDRMGLGFFLGDETRPDLFGHIGGDAGFQALLIMFSDSGQGAVVMYNSEHGFQLGDFVFEQIAKQYGWKNYVRSDRPHPHPSR